MKSKVAVVFAFALATLWTTACDRNPETPKIDSPAADAAPAGDRSVALPQNSVPPSDASIPPPVGAAGTQGSGDANSPTQANPAELQKSQEQAQMPMSGQVNNHSVPETGGQPK